MSASSARTARWREADMRCDRCGASLYSLVIHGDPTPDTDGTRILFRHGDGARAQIIEWQYSESAGEFVCGHPDVIARCDAADAGDGSWERHWHDAIHGEAVPHGR